MEQIERIRQMEQIFDRAEAAVSALRKAMEAYRGLESELERLEAYYENGLWQRDFQDDEAGKIPAELKRGVLSEDGVWNLLIDRDAIQAELLEWAEKLKNP